MFKKYGFCLKLRKMFKDKIDKRVNEAAKISAKRNTSQKKHELLVNKDRGLLWEE